MGEATPLSEKRRVPHHHSRGLRGHMAPHRHRPGPQSAANASANTPMDARVGSLASETSSGRGKHRHELQDIYRTGEIPLRCLVTCITTDLEESGSTQNSTDKKQPFWKHK